MSEPRAYKVKRLKMRAMRRGIKEMDLILTAFADAKLDGMDDEGLSRFDALLEENDQDLYQWVTGQKEAPSAHADLLRDVAQIFQK